jgi:hypothetical protein
LGKKRGQMQGDLIARKEKKSDAAPLFLWGDIYPNKKTLKGWGAPLEGWEGGCCRYL